MAEEIKYNFIPEIGFHEFYQGNCSIILRKEEEEVFSLDSFRCNDKHYKGEGRKLLLYTLKWVKEYDKDITTITLTAVPDTEKIIQQKLSREDFYKEKEKALLNLKKYYRELGFNSVKNNDMQGNLDDIILKIEGVKTGGGNKKSRRRRRRCRLYKNKKTHKK